MTAPTVDTPLKCPDCGNALRHVAGEDWACTRCKDPQTQSGERYWRVVAPAAAETQHLKNASAFFVWLIDYLGFSDAEECWGEEINLEMLRLQVMGHMEDLKTQFTESETALLAARREVEALRGRVEFLLKHYVESADGKFAFPDGDTWDCSQAPDFDALRREVGGFSAEDEPEDAP